MATALFGEAGGGKIVCVVSGGNIDAPKLGRILAGETPSDGSFRRGCDSRRPRGLVHAASPWPCDSRIVQGSRGTIPPQREDPGMGRSSAAFLAGERGRQVARPGGDSGRTADRRGAASTPFRPTEPFPRGYRPSRLAVAAVALASGMAAAQTPVPRFENDRADPPLGRSAGEPSLGVSRLQGHQGRVMYIAGVETLGLDYDECTSPPRGSWEDVSFVLTNQETLDPILFTDPDTGRTFVSQLLFPTKQSAMAFTDDEGASWGISQGSGINSGVDHQTVGGGPFPASDPVGPSGDYPHAVYYCAQDVGDANCALSRDGGVTFGPAAIIYDVNQCDGLHGHIKVAPDGTAYVPNGNCAKALGDPLGFGEPGVVRSLDAGATWTTHTVPGRAGGSPWDPAVAVGSNGRVYFGWEENGQPMVAVSSDRGESWDHVQDVGVELGINWAAFPQMTAGDDDRAAFAFLGATYQGPGDPYGEDATLPAVWHLYVSVTYDGGASWTTVNATPGDPVQRGTVCGAGLGCTGTTRNLLDFNDVQIDARGYVVAAYADGCLSGCLNGPPNTGAAVAAVARQVSGLPLLSAFDPDGSETPPGVRLRALVDPMTNIVDLAWDEPDDRGSALTGYTVYRREVGGSEIVLASPPPTERAYTDDGRAPGVDYRYEVTASNANGEGDRCGEVEPVIFIPPNHCDAPGVLVATDPQGDAPNDALDIESLHVSEPVQPDEADRLVFELKVRDLSGMAPGNTWIIMWNRPYPDAEFDRNFVAMRVTGPGTAQFTYGQVTPPNENRAVESGAADGGTFFPDGTIRIIIANDKVESPMAGQDLSQLEARSFVAHVNGQPATQLSAADFTTAGLYSLIGNRFCDPTPSAVADVAATPEGQPIDIDVLANDTDRDMQPLTIVGLGVPQHGSATLNPDGTVHYESPLHFAGVDTFSYTIEDTEALTDTASVTVTVFRAAPSQQPIAQDDDPDDDSQRDEDGRFTLSWSFPGPPNSPPCAFRIEQSTGTVADFEDDAAEPLVASENTKWVGDSEWISSAHPDTATPGYSVVYTDEIDASLSLRDPIALPVGPTRILLSFDSSEDIEEDFDYGIVESSVGSEEFRQLAAFTGAFSGRRVIDLSHLVGTSARLRFRFLSDQLVSTPLYLGWFIDNIRIETADWVGLGTVLPTTTSLTLARPDGRYFYRVAGMFGAACDEIGPYSDVRDVTVALGTLEPRAPIAAGDFATAVAGTPLTIDVLANDFDPNGDPLVVGAVSQPVAGGAVADNGGDVTFTPAPGFTGTVVFEYQACDPGPLCDSAHVLVTVAEEEVAACSPPGVRVATDAPGDTDAVLDPSADPSLDLLSVSFAEPFLGERQEKLVVTIAVADFGVPHPSAAWRVVWRSPDGLDHFVSLESCDATVGIACSYGTYDGTLFSSEGQAAGCSFEPDGTLSITVDKNLVGIIDALHDGVELTGIQGLSQVFVGALCNGLLGTTDDVAAQENYRIFTNERCQCGTIDGLVTLSVDEAGADAVLSWTAVSGATRYDVVRGDVGTLQASGGDFASATETCAVNDETATSALVTGTAAPGEGHFYLVRPATICAAGSYDGLGGAGRDSGIVTSGHDCP